MSVVVRYLKQVKLNQLEEKAKIQIKSIINDGGKKRLKNCLPYWKGLLNFYNKNKKPLSDCEIPYLEFLIKHSNKKLKK